MGTCQLSSGSAENLLPSIRTVTCHRWLLLLLRRDRVFDDRKQIVIAVLAGARQQLLCNDDAHLTAIIFNLLCLGHCPFVQLLDLFNGPFSFGPILVFLAFKFGLVAVGEEANLDSGPS